MTIIYRQLTTVAELNTAVDLEITVWKMDPRDAVPLNIMRSIALHGGAVIGAYAGERLVGMSVAFPMRPEKHWICYSHMAGVHPDYQGQGIGFGIKQTQRLWAIDQGYDEMHWTYDPLQRGNANFNLHRLGATASIYLQDYYGVMLDEINPQIPSDRLEVIWKLKDARVAALAAGQPPSPVDLNGSVVITIDDVSQPVRTANVDFQAMQLLVPIPRSLGQLDHQGTLIWRLTLREILEDAFARGYVAVDFVEHDGQPCYILEAPTPYFMYVVECSDQSLYTGITNNLTQRLQQHNNGRGAAYTRSRGPVSLLGAWKFANRSRATQAEAAFKRMKRTDKLIYVERGRLYRDSTEFLSKIP